MKKSHNLFLLKSEVLEILSVQMQNISIFLLFIFVFDESPWFLVYYSINLSLLSYIISLHGCTGTECL